MGVVSLDHIVWKEIFGGQKFRELLKNASLSQFRWKTFMEL